jgi:hypothetical protein
MRMVSNFKILVPSFKEIGNLYFSILLHCSSIGTMFTIFCTQRPIEAFDWVILLSHHKVITLYWAV